MYCDLVPMVTGPAATLTHGYGRHSAQDVIAAIEAYLTADDDPKPFVWTATTTSWPKSPEDESLSELLAKTATHHCCRSDDHDRHVRV